MTDLASQERRLLELVKSEREKACRDAAREAEAQAAALLEEAWRNGRARLHRAVNTERERARERIAHARAGMETRKRLHQQSRQSALLDFAWGILEQRLREMWQERQGRQRWIAAAARQALARIPPNQWRIIHPPTWNAEDQRLLANQLGDGLAKAPQFEPDQALSAGLMVRSGGVALDMTLEGMLADRNAIEARLLAMLEQEEP
jgi:hypothetical protein